MVLGGKGIAMQMTRGNTWLKTGDSDISHRLTKRRTWI